MIVGSVAPAVCVKTATSEAVGRLPPTQFAVDSHASTPGPVNVTSAARPGGDATHPNATIVAATDIRKYFSRFVVMRDSPSKKKIN